MKRNEQGARGGARRPDEWSVMSECAAIFRPGIMSNSGHGPLGVESPGSVKES